MNLVVCCFSPKSAAPGTTFIWQPHQCTIKKKNIQGVGPKIPSNLNPSVMIKVNLGAAHGQGRRILLSFAPVHLSPRPRSKAHTYVLKCHTWHASTSPPFALFWKSLGCGVTVSMAIWWRAESCADYTALAPADWDKRMAPLWSLFGNLHTCPERERDSEHRKSGRIWGMSAWQLLPKIWEKNHLIGLERIVFNMLEIYPWLWYKCWCEIVPQLSLKAGQGRGKSGSLLCWFSLSRQTGMALISSVSCWKSLLVWPDISGDILKMGHHKLLSAEVNWGTWQTGTQPMRDGKISALALDPIHKTRSLFNFSYLLAVWETIRGLLVLSCVKSCSLRAYQVPMGLFEIKKTEKIRF